MKRTVIAVLVVLAYFALAAPASSSALTFDGVRCQLIDVPAAAPFGPGPCPGVRPGGRVLAPRGRCTLNFLFNGGDGRRYMGTAGHCVLGDSPLAGQDVGERRWTEGTGPVAKDALGKRIGEFAYAALKSPKDFALIRLDGNVAANPSICHFGGPTGSNGATSPGGTPLPHYGNGVVVGSILPARTMFALGLPSPDSVYAFGLALPGDSGGPVISTDGRAVGLVIAIGVGIAGPTDMGTVLSTRIAPQVARAAAVLGTSLALQTAQLQ